MPKPDPQCDGVRRQGLWEVIKAGVPAHEAGILGNGILCPYQGDRRELAYFPPGVEDTVRRQAYEAGSRPHLSTGTSSLWPREINTLLFRSRLSLRHFGYSSLNRLGQWSVAQRGQE